MLKATRKQRFSHEYVAEFLKKRGITLLAKEYKSTFSPIECRCDFCEKEWRPRFGNIRAGSGCPRCANKRRNAKRQYTHKFVSDYFDEHGIDLLSTEYVNSAKKLRVRFRDCGHEISASFNAIQQGHLCPKCAINARVPREEYEALALARGGQLVEMAKSATLPSTWLCNRGSHPHQFKRSYTVLMQTQTFCTYCSTGLAERQCRAVAEQIFRRRFWRIRVKEIRGIGGKPLELDIYNAALKLAIEHNGSQHYKPQKNWGGKAAFDRQVEHDRRRRKFCQKKGITLIEIRELNRVTQISDLKQIIKEACIKGGVVLPVDFDEIQLDLNDVNVKTEEEAMWERILKRANEVNYTVLSKGYPGVQGKLQLICNNGHSYTPRTVQFLTGYLCRKCWLNEKRVPIVVFPLTNKCQNFSEKVGQVFDSIEQAAKVIRANPNNVRSAVRKKQICGGYGIGRVTLEQAKVFQTSPERLREFCEARWPNWKSYDPLANFRLRFGKPVVLSDGRRFASASEAARQLGVTKAPVLAAIRNGNKCCGFTIKRVTEK